MDINTLGAAIAVAKSIPGTAAQRAEAAQAAAEAVAESIPQDYSTLSEDVQDLKSAITVMEPSATSLDIGKALVVKTVSGGKVTEYEYGNVSDPTDEQVDSAVSDWLNEHPEATTTVEDGSLTVEKFSDALGYRAFNRYVTPQMYGAEADGVTDDTEAIQSALTYSTNNGGGVYFPPGTYLVTEKLLFKDVNYIEMDSKAILKAGTNVIYVVEIAVTGYPVQRPLVKNIRIDGNDVAVNGVYLNGISNAGCVCVSGMIVENCTDNGVVFENCQGGLFEAIKSEGNGGDGIRIIGCNNSKFISISALDNGGDGIVFNKSQGAAASGAVYVFGAHSEQNTGCGLHFISTGLTSVLTGWLEGNDGTPIVIENDSKCLISGFRIIWSGEGVPFAEINSDFATIRDIEIQGGSGTTYIPIVNGTSTIENVQTAVLQGFSLYGTNIAEKLLQNVLPNGDMQGGQSTGAFSVYYASKEYQNTDIVDTGKTYSFKAVSENGAFVIRKDSVSNFLVGVLYKITCRVYLVGSDCKLRLGAADQTLNKTVYGAITSIEGNKWNELTGYFYPQTDGEIRISCGTIGSDTYSSVGAIFYVSELICQPCVEKHKIATKRIGNDWVYNTIEPVIMS